MCGRLTLTTPAKTLALLFDGLSFSGFEPRFNICPTQTVACIRNTHVDDDDALAVRELAPLRWGLIPSWAKDLKMGARMINARSETVATKPSFRSAFKKRRCLVVADGFYEWRKQGKQKQPYFISQANEKPFTLAGLWESWTDPANHQVIESCTILTTSANAMMAPLHDRMPVFLDTDHHEIWLDAGFQDVNHLESILAPCPDEQLQAWPVDTIVNKPINDTPKCIEEIELS